jgi:metal-responsive CopG/Arc/MetJ family transcriptional regulator
MSEEIVYVSIHVRLLKEQYEWLRKYSYENRVSQAEVIRKVLEMYIQEKCKL